VTKEEFKLVKVGDRVKAHTPYWSQHMCGTVIGTTFSKIQVQFDNGIITSKAYMTLIHLKEGDDGFRQKI